MVLVTSKNKHVQNKCTHPNLLSKSPYDMKNTYSYVCVAS